MIKDNRKGFTLVELLAVIIILALLALITGTSVTKILKNSKENLYNDQLTLIKSAAENWGAQNMTKLPDSGECKIITIKTLKDSGFINSSVIDPNTKEEMSDDLQIKITGSKNKAGRLVTNYEVNPSDVKGCIIPNMYVDSNLNGADPYLYSGLVPVLYDYDESSKTGNWVAADPSTKWYDYSNQEWANAVILKSGVTKNPGETVTVDGTDPEALAMFVWIPRYEYKIDGQYGKEGTSEKIPGEIEINFMSRKTTKPTEGYIIHPAFSFGNTQLSGIWVGKFETTGSDGAPTILPNKQSLRNQTVAKQFETAQLFNTLYLKSSSVDTHMAKNSEWGAVAYLSQSKYGKYGNNKFLGTEKEVYINNSGGSSEGYYTGRSGGAPSEEVPTVQEKYKGQSSTNRYNDHGYYTYDGYFLNYDGTNTGTKELLKGTGASTTGNISGVYDMSGGSWEYVMGYLTTAYTSEPELGLPWGAAKKSDYAKFTDEPEKKYYDAYTTEDKMTACNDVCYGHALSETWNWYGDTEYFASLNDPWLRRGGRYYNDSSAGIFSSDNNNGDVSDHYTFRVVLSSADN